MTTVKDRPIIMTAESVNAIRAGRKTQTRRVADVPPVGNNGVGPVREIVPSLLANRGDLWDVRYDGDNPRAVRCPYSIGDRLWVKEAWAGRLDPGGKTDPNPRYVKYRADDDEKSPNDPMDWHLWPDRWKSPRFMPRWASRITLEITAVRAERLNEITEEDAAAEGAREAITSRDGRAFDIDEKDWCLWSKKLDPAATMTTARGAFASAWQRINGKRPGCSWADSPWVWVISFRALPPAAEGGTS